MQLNPIYTLQSIANQHFIFMRNNEQVDLTRIISLNNTAAWLWLQLEKKEFTCEDAVELLTGHFYVDYPTAISDVYEWLEFLEKNELLYK